MAKLVFETVACLVAQRIPGISPDARKSHIRTSSKQILSYLPREVDVVCEVDEAHGESPNVPLEDVLARVFVCDKAANPALS